MRIGTDISIACCRREGYMVMDFKKRELIKKGVFDKDCQVTLSVSNPEAWNDAGKPMIGENRYLWSLEPIDYSWNDLMYFLDNPARRAGIANCCDWKNCSPNFDNPNVFDLLHLASDIYFYCGLN